MNIGCMSKDRPYFFFDEYTVSMHACMKGPGYEAKNMS